MKELLPNSPAKGEASTFLSKVDSVIVQPIRRVGAPQQYLADVMIGYSLDRLNQLGINAGAGRSISSDKRSVSNLLANRDLNHVRVAGNYGHSFNKRINLNLYLFYTVAGRNTGEGYGAALSLMYKLPYR